MVHKEHNRKPVGGLVTANRQLDKVAAIGYSRNRELSRSGSRSNGASLHIQPQ